MLPDTGTPARDSAEPAAAIAPGGDRVARLQTVELVLEIVASAVVGIDTILAFIVRSK